MSQKKHNWNQKARGKGGAKGRKNNTWMQEGPQCSSWSPAQSQDRGGPTARTASSVAPRFVVAAPCCEEAQSFSWGLQGFQGEKTGPGGLKEPQLGTACRFCPGPGGPTRSSAGGGRRFRPEPTALASPGRPAAPRRSRPPSAAPRSARVRPAPLRLPQGFPHGSDAGRNPTEARLVFGAKERLGSRLPTLRRSPPPRAALLSSRPCI